MGRPHTPMDMIPPIVKPRTVSGPPPDEPDLKTLARSILLKDQADGPYLQHVSEEYLAGLLEAVENERSE